jgi:uncharacterized protein YbgA (DUF1722 family)/uncharacterized protein YbbK (DUF523 family)
MSTPIRLGISACLLGQNVRYDGTNQRDPFLTETLGRFVQYVPVCPEVEAGFGAPREPMRLVGNSESPRLVTSRTNRDLTEPMRSWARKRVVELEQEDLCGFIFKKGSPSSGMERVKVYSEKGIPSRKGVGMFARAFMEHFPGLPVEEEGRLHDPALRENFVERVFTLRRWRQAQEKKSRGSLVDFHTRHKLLLLAHSPRHYQLMGRLIAGAKSLSIPRLYEQYQALLADALALPVTTKKNTNVLLHIMGYFKTNLSPDEKQELLELLDQYRRHLVPLIVPVTLLNHYIRKYAQPYLSQQVFLNPHPIELQLRNHV